MPCPVCGALSDGKSSRCSACGSSGDDSRTPTLLQTKTSGTKAASLSPADDDRFAPGSTIAGRYRIVELLGRGGMGEVVRAEDLSLGQQVALKILSPALAGDPGALDRVREEVRMARRVSHRNVCRVHDIGTAGAHLFISMEYVHGEDLASLLRRVGRVAGDRALEIARELCAGLSAAHAAGVIHRDLKPANVMLDRDGQVRVTDFGLARLRDAGANPGELAGTPAYMAPEQLAGMAATVRSDVYALGLVLYELFTGRKAFGPAASLSELLRVRRETAVVPPGDVVRELDPNVARSILQCLAVKPEERPDSALAVLTSLSGGDPLKAALAAGQTPSPSAVAAAPVAGVLTPARAWSSAAFVVAYAAFFMFQGAKVTPLEHVRPPFPPAVLSVKAEEAMRALGGVDGCADSASGFSYDDAALKAAAASRVGDAATRAAAERRSIVFWHRCSAVPLVPLGQTDVTHDNPPMQPEESRVALDVDGHVLRYQEGPLAGGGARSGRGAPDAVSTFLRLAGVEAVGRPTTAGGPLSIEVRSDRGIPERMEGEMRGDRLVEATLFAPWMAPARRRATRVLDPEDVPDLLIVCLVLVSLPVAWRNLRLGRGDRQGAIRVGLLVFGCALASRTLDAHHTGTFAGEFNVLKTGLGLSLYFCLTTVLLYLALEPFVRRLWPERLVSWSRLLAGDVRDPMVARDVLLGITTYCSMAAIFAVSLLGARVPLLPVRAGLEPLMGPLPCVAATAVAIAVAVRLGLVLLLLLLFLRFFGRIRWLAPLVFLGLATAMNLAFFETFGVPDALGIPMAAGFAISLYLLLIRAGLLAITVTMIFGVISLMFPTLRLTGWMAFCGWWVLGICVLTVAYGVYFSTGGRPFGDRDLLEKV